MSDNNTVAGNRADFDGKVALITGAGKGLGKSYAVFLAKKGAKVVVNNRRHADQQPGASSADQVVDLIRQSGGDAVANYCDVESATAGQEMVAQVMDTYGRLDILIANAGVEEACAFHRQKLEDLTQIFDINFFGSLYVAQAAYREMRSSGFGRIVFSSSGAGLYGNHGMAAYSSSKAALLGLTNALSIEGADHNITVNAIAPYAATPMTEKYLPDAMKSDLSPDMVAPVVAYLCSDACRYNGECFVTAGGTIRRAQMTESRGATLDATGLTNLAAVGEALELATDMSHAQHFPSANVAFEDILR